MDTPAITWPQELGDCACGMWTCTGQCAPVAHLIRLWARTAELLTILHERQQDILYQRVESDDYDQEDHYADTR